MSLINQCSVITCARIILFVILQVNGKTEDNHCVNEGQIIRYDEEDQSIHWNNLKTPYKYELTINDKPPIITNETTFNVGDDIPSCSDVKILLRTVDKDDKFGNVFCVEYELEPDPPHNFQITVKENLIVATWETPPNMEVCRTETYQIQTRGKAINVTEQKYVFDYIPYCYNMDIRGTLFMY